ncbi:MAG: DUF72 domain-containing protein [Myxococcota bacterium]
MPNDGAQGQHEDELTGPETDVAADVAPGGDAPQLGLRIGCADLPPGLRRVRYFQRLQYLELEGLMYRIPKAKVLRRWPDETGPRGRFGLVASQVITHKPGRGGYRRGGDGLDASALAQAGWFRDTEVVHRAVAEFAHAASLVPTDVVIFRSPPDFSPSAGNRDRLRAFFAESAPAEAFPGMVRVWEPHGLWEPQVAAKLAGEMGVIYGCDPTANDPLGVGPEFFAALPHTDAYFRLTGLGRARQRYDEYALDELLGIVEGYERAWLVFAHPDRYPDAIRLHRLLSPADANSSEDPDEFDSPDDDPDGQDESESL